jgi:hypothetical protein
MAAERRAAGRQRGEAGIALRRAAVGPLGDEDQGANHNASGGQGSALEPRPTANTWESHDARLEPPRDSWRLRYLGRVILRCLDHDC